ncbi:MAG: right-handed parallel beta-helix repeat-containing protein [Planctomycetota bacterium]|jgi:hypothetical protein
MDTKTNLKTGLVISVCLLGIVGTAAGQIIYVDADANGADDGSSWTDARNYLQDALADANSDPNVDEIWVAQGVYKPDANSADPNGSGDRTATFQLINGLALIGGYAGNGEPDPNARDIEAYETILSGDLDGNDADVNDPCDLWWHPSRAENSYHVVTANDVNTVVNGFTITAGNADGNTVSGHSHGGGMTNLGGRPSVIHCSFNGNSAVAGGGVYCAGSNPTFANSTIKGNYGYYGGGGGIGCESNSSLTLTNCVIAGNSTHEYGGAIKCVTSGSLTLTNCTLSGNSSWQLAAGIFGVGVSSMTLNNCILWNDMSGVDNEVLLVASSPPMVSYCDFQGGPNGVIGAVVWGAGNIDADPCLADPNHDDYHLLLGSPCIDAGDNNSVPADSLDLDGDGNTTEPIPFDLDGKPRFIDDSSVLDTGNGMPPIVDMGAYEYVPPVYNVVQGKYYEKIQEGIADANNGDEIVLSPRTYTGSGNRDVDFLGRS